MSTLFRTFEKLFRRGGAVRCEADAVAAGAVDFAASSSDARALALPCPLGSPQPVFVLPEHPGFFMLPGALCPRQRAALALAVLREYIEPPLCRRSRVAAPLGGLWVDYQRARGAAEPPPPLHALAWATLGVHYDWERRLYPSREAGWRSPFPPALHAHCAGVVQRAQEAAALARLPPGFHGSQPFASDAAIVSLYHSSRSKSRLPMGGHKDDAQGEDQGAPIASLSLGATAVFLLGGADKSAPPTPLLLRSGDAMLLAGSARSCVHGVPRVLCQEEGEPSDSSSVGPLGEEAALARFLASARINITVRSVPGDAPGLE